LIFLQPLFCMKKVILADFIRLSFSQK
jgi:hypothetical protein